MDTNHPALVKCGFCISNKLPDAASAALILRGAGWGQPIPGGGTDCFGKKKTSEVSQPENFSDAENPFCTEVRVSTCLPGSR